MENKTKNIFLIIIITIITLIIVTYLILSSIIYNNKYNKIQNIKAELYCNQYDLNFIQYIFSTCDSMISSLCQDEPIGECYSDNNKDKYFYIYKSDLINETN